jgi:hypothetical protein
MMGKKTVLTIGALMTSAALAFAATPLHAASACKGLEKRACGNNSKCAWVDGYTRKDGVKVSGHCRTKSGKKKSTSSRDKQ